MNVFEMVVILVGIGAIASLGREWIKAKRSGVRLDLDELAHDLGLDDGYYDKQQIKPYLERIERLEERIKVLERIVTDRESRLAAEIDRLA
ncbi:hypothetical protein [Luteithermobacter gelatinilyticus]|uniref:hypothetical protein n=1 Tax=Luteithermobacter gelatinilyticus TaxID=2582913 RepID=UPI001106D313|nr:hypothetical protein [Luteithermobacter gelatinilyticus]